MKRKTLYIASTTFLCGAMIISGCSRAKPVGLDLLGYNYTDRMIESYTVTDQAGNSAWGGSVLLSSDGIPGGSDACCVMLNEETTSPVQLNVSWDFGVVRDKSGKVISPEIDKKSSVVVKPPFPKDPHILEIHFYQDGHVEAAVSQYGSPPRITHPNGTPGTAQ